MPITIQNNFGQVNHIENSQVVISRDGLHIHQTDGDVPDTILPNDGIVVSSSDNDSAINAEELRKSVKLSYLRETQPINLFENMLKILSEPNWADKDYARFALILYNSKRLNESETRKPFSKWYKHFAEDIIHCSYHKDYKQSNLKETEKTKVIKSFL